MDINLSEHALTKSICLYIQHHTVPTDKLSLTEFIKVPGRRGTINIPQQIGSEYIAFGMSLLDDKTGKRVTEFVCKHKRDFEAINMEILQKWLDGEGKHPVTWKTLIDVLRGIKMDSLADEIEVGKHLRPGGRCWSTQLKLKLNVVGQVLS